MKTRKLAPLTPRNPATQWRYVFTRVIEIYSEAKQKSGRCSQFHYENSQQRPRNSPFIRPSMVDFIADVEIAARCVLTPVELVLFANRFAHLIDRPIPERITKHIEETLGQEFISRGIFPLNQYFSPRLIEKHGKV